MSEDWNAGLDSFEQERVHFHRGGKMANRFSIGDEILRQAQDMWQIEVEMLERCWESLSRHFLMTATALYHYAEFEGDGDWAKSLSVPRLTTRLFPSSGKDWLKLWLYHRYEAVHTLGRQLFQWGWRKLLRRGYLPSEWRWLPYWPRAWECEFETVEEITKEEWDNHIPKVQDALAAQFWYLRKLGLEPQAVLAAPSVAGRLFAINTPIMERAAFVYPQGLPSFLGLPVISCSELQWGAIVV